MAKLSKRQKALQPVDREKFYGVDEALSLVKSNATAKFDETVEVAMNLGVDPRHADQMVRGVVNLPNGSGRNVRVAVFARGDKAEQASSASRRPASCMPGWARRRSPTRRSWRTSAPLRTRLAAPSRPAPRVP